MDIVKELELHEAVSQMDSESTYIITKSKTEKDKLAIPYTMMGNGKSSQRTGMASLDVLDTCIEMNRSEITLFKYFRDAYMVNSINREENPNIVNTAYDENMTQYLKTALKKNYSHMEYLKVIKRIRRGLYMVNPYLVVPSKHNLEILEEWNELTKEEDDNPTTTD